MLSIFKYKVVLVDLHDIGDQLLFFWLEKAGWIGIHLSQSLILLGIHYFWKQKAWQEVQRASWVDSLETREYLLFFQET